MAPENRTIFAGRGKLSHEEKAERVKDMYMNNNIQTMMRKKIDYKAEKGRPRRDGEPEYNLFDGNHSLWPCYYGYIKGDFPIALLSLSEKMKWFDLEDESIVPSGPVFIYATDKARDDALRNDIGGYHATIPPTALAAIHDTRICMIDLPIKMSNDEAYTRAEKANNCTPLLPAERMKIRRAKNSEMAIKYRALTVDGLDEDNINSDAHILQRILVDDFYKYQASFLVALDKQSLTRRYFERISIITSVNSLDQVLENPRNSAGTLTERQLSHIAVACLDIMNTTLSRLERDVDRQTRFTLKDQHLVGIIFVALELAYGGYRHATGEDENFFKDIHHLGIVQSSALRLLQTRVEDAIEIVRKLDHDEKKDKVGRIYHLLVTGTWLSHDAAVMEKKSAKRQRCA